MIRPFIVVLIIVGACAVYPYAENEKKLGSLVESPAVPVNVPLTVDGTPLPTEFPNEDLDKKGPTHEGTDLKTDATFWWPFSYRSYNRYPYYRYYRPRVYYRYYYW